MSIPHSCHADVIGIARMHIDYAEMLGQRNSVHTVLYIIARWGIGEAASAKPCGFVVPTWPLLGHHAGQAALEPHWHLVHCIQLPVMQHPPELQLTCTLTPLHTCRQCLMARHTSCCCLYGCCMETEVYGDSEQRAASCSFLALKESYTVENAACESQQQMVASWQHAICHVSRQG